MRVWLLGGVDVATGTGRTRAVPGKRGCVLAALALTPAIPVSAESLVWRVWGEDPPDSALSALYAHITRLRGTLDSSGLEIRRVTGGYQLDIDPGEVDVLATRQLAERARRHSEAGQWEHAAADWRRARALLRGEALAGVSGAWAGEVRTGFQREAVSILAEGYAAESRLSGHARVLPELSAAAARYPTSEALAAQLMTALYRCGRQAEALDVFAGIRTLLRDRLGADPSEELRHLHRRILRQDTEIAPPGGEGADDAAEPLSRSPAQLPATTSAFVGRDSQIAACQRAMNRSNVVVIDGMAGVGKTALAVHAVRDVLADYPDGQLFLDLHGFSGDVPALSPHEALERLLRALGVANSDIPTGTDERSATLRTVLTGRRVVLLLDNASDSAQVTPVLPGTADCLTVITSRRKLPDLMDAYPISLDVLEPHEADRLFVTAVDDPARTQGQEAQVRQLVEACGRLPLAIRIAAARLRSRPQWTTDYLLRRVRDSHRALDELAARDHAVAPALEASYRELDEEHRRMFRLLGVYPGQDIDASTAAALADVSEPAADRALETLVDNHLLTAPAADGYQFHDLIRQYAHLAAQREESAVSRNAALRRVVDLTIARTRQAFALQNSHVAFYPHLVDLPRQPPPLWKTAAEATRWFRSQRANLTGVLEACFKHDMDLHAAELSAVLSVFTVRFGFDSERDKLARHGLRVARKAAHKECQGFFLNHLGTNAKSGGQPHAAIEYLSQALTIRRELRDHRAITSTLYDLGLVYAHLGRYDEAIATLEEAVRSAAGKDSRIQAAAHTNLTIPLLALGRVADAESHLDRAREMMAGVGDERVRMLVRYGRGQVAYLKGDYVTALRFHEEVAAYSRAHHETVGIATNLIAAGYDLKALGRTAEALEYSEQAIEVLGNMVRPVIPARAHLLAGQVRLARGEYSQALDQLHHARRIALGDDTAAQEYRDMALAFFANRDMPEAAEIKEWMTDMDTTTS